MTEAVRRRPYQVILFDEIEKAHPDVWNSLLQILEEGHLTDGHGRTVDFGNTVIVMTSNIGTRFANRRGVAIGFQVASETGEDEQFVDDVSESLKRTFRPEFLNRIDEVIIFQRLTRESLVQIVTLQIKEIADRLREQDMAIELSDAATEWLAEKGYDPIFGARPLRRTIQRFVESPLSQKLLEGAFDPGDTVLVDLDPESVDAADRHRLVFEKKVVAEVDEEQDETENGSTPAQEEAREKEVQM